MYLHFSAEIEELKKKKAAKSEQSQVLEYQAKEREMIEARLRSQAPQAGVLHHGLLPGSAQALVQQRNLLERSQLMRHGQAAAYQDRLNAFGYPFQQ